MKCTQVLDDGFTRIPQIAKRAVEGLDADGLVWTPKDGANPIGWLVWHLSRVQDDHVADLLDEDQLWLIHGWERPFGLPSGTTETGFGHTREQVAAIRPEGPAAVLGYLEAVTDHTRSFLGTLEDDDLDRVVDSSWDPPVTMAVRLVSMLSDGLQHAGQAAYLRGLHDRTVTST